MRRTVRSILLLTASLALSTVPVWAASQYVSLEGKWSLNLNETHYPPGFPSITKNDMNVTKDDGKILQFTENLTMDGKDVTSTWDGAYDGKMRPTSDGQQLAWHHVSARTAGDERKNAEGVTTGKSACAISADGAHMTCHIQAFSSKNPKPIKFVEIFDKVQ